MSITLTQKERAESARCRFRIGILSVHLSPMATPKIYRNRRHSGIGSGDSVGTCSRQRLTPHRSPRFGFLSKVKTVVTASSAELPVLRLRISRVELGPLGGVIPQNSRKREYFRLTALCVYSVVFMESANSGGSKKKM